MAADSLVTGIHDLNKEMQALNESLRKGASNKEAAKKSREEANANLNKGLIHNAAVLGASTHSVNALITAINDLQVQSLSLGTSLFSVRSVVGDGLRDLPAGLSVGLQEATANIAEGFDTFNQSFVKAQVRASLTDKSNKALRGVMSDLVSIGGMQESGLTSLSEVLIETSNKYKIQTGFLVASMEAVSDSFGILGGKVAGKLLEGVAKLTGLAGAKFSDEVQQFAKLFVPTMENSILVAKLGISAEADAIARGENVFKNFDIAAQKAALALGSNTNVGKKTFVGLAANAEMMKSIGGESAFAIARLGERLTSLTSTIRDQLETEEKFTKSLDGIREELKSLVAGPAGIALEGVATAVTWLRTNMPGAVGGAVGLGMSAAVITMAKVLFLGLGPIAWAVVAISVIAGSLLYYASENAKYAKATADNTKKTPEELEKAVFVDRVSAMLDRAIKIQAGLTKQTIMVKEDPDSNSNNLQTRMVELLEEGNSTAREGVDKKTKSPSKTRK